MTELSFLLDLLLDCKLSKPARAKVLERIKEVEKQWVYNYVPPVQASGRNVMLHGAPQAASTIALMEGHEPEVQQAVPFESVAQTPAAAAALASRQQAIAESIAGKIDKTTGKPRKW